MADPFERGLAFRDFFTKTIPGKVADMSNADAAGFHQSMADVHSFISGLTGGPRPSVTVQLPPAKPAAAAKGGKPPTGMGELSPAAAAVLANAASPAPKGAAAADDGTAALGKLSFRQLLSLSQASENLQPRGAIKQPTAADAAGELLMKMTLPAFQATLAKQPDDVSKQKVIDSYRDQVLLPIISHGNPMAGMFDTGGQ